MAIDFPNGEVRIPIEGFVSPGMSDLNPWATHKAKYGQGGMEVVNTIADRDAITDERKIDKVVFVKDTGQWFYFDIDWKEVDFLSVDVKDNSGSNRVNDVSLLEFVGATVSAGNDPGKAVVTVTGGSGGVNGIVVTEDNSTYLGVETLEVENMDVVKLSDTSLHLKPLIDVNEVGSNVHAWPVSSISIENPLTVKPISGDRDGVVTGVQLGVEHGVFEPIKSPSYLAYIKDDTEVVGKIKDAGAGHTKGTLWFDDVIVSGSPYIVTDIDNKAYGIQEADQLDPNVTGGTDYLVAFRIHMNGKAPEDGKVRMYLAKRAYNDLQSDGYLTDTNGQPMVVERSYKAGEALDVMEVMGIVNAKAIVEFTCHVVDSFTSDNVTLTDRTEGCSGLLLQALTSTSKTGEGLLQFENDTAQNIEFSSHYLGSARMNINWLVATADPVVNVPANADVTLGDGVVVHTLSKAKIGKVDSHLHFEDNSEPLDFYFGKMFSAEETRMLRGKSVTAKVTLVDKANAFKIALVKWTGQPDAFTSPIYTKRSGNTPTFNQGWESAGEMVITSDFFAGDHTDTKSFTIPSDANNYGFIIYPLSVEQPCKLQLKSFDVDVDTPFIGYVMTGAEQLNQAQWAYSDQYRRLVQDRQGYSALRYTINVNEIPMPCGELRDGLADIAIDTRYNKVAGSTARGGEGCIRFDADGQATISTTLRLWSEKAPSSDTGVIFWYSKVSPNGTMTKIPASERVVAIAGGSQGMIVTMPSFGLKVKAGDMIALRAQGDADDAAFLQCNDDSKPMVSTSIDFNEEKATTPLISTNWQNKTLEDRRTITFTGNTLTTLVYDLTVPAGSMLANVTVMSKAANGSLTKVANTTFQVDVANRKLRVNIGTGIKDGELYLEFWG